LHFEELCRHIREAGTVAFDTEFVSEYTHRPELGLLQFATPTRSVAVDPYAVPQLDAWWELMCDDQTTVVVHGGQAEIAFCLRFAGRAPRRLVDIQLAEGLRSRSYPLGYAALVTRVLGKRVHGKETRTDWRRRPLSRDQIRYAIEDVQHILPVWERQKQSLARLERIEWAEAEFRRFVSELETEAARESWQKLPGIHRLSPRELAVLRELAVWREAEAARRNRPLRRVLRDDLLVEMARRQPRNTAEVLATRDMDRPEYRRAAGDLVDCVQRGLDVPDGELPVLMREHPSDTGHEEHVLSKLLAIALANRCAELNVSRQLVGTSSDLRDLVRWHLGEHREGPPPSLATGWRALVCGDLLTDLLDGKVRLRVGDPLSDHPLVFERVRVRRTR
jgi:ribonuclease D